jgi:hypothetical protein
MMELVHSEAVNLPFELKQQRLDDTGHRRLALDDGLTDCHPLFDPTLIHSCKAHIKRLQ